jgi:hypothetical protein
MPHSGDDCRERWRKSHSRRKDNNVAVVIADDDEGGDEGQLAHCHWPNIGRMIPLLGSGNNGI